MTTMHNVQVDWRDGMSFETVLNGHQLIMDSDIGFGGDDRGPRPKPLLLAALAGCSGMDVVSLLSKMRAEVEDVKIDVGATMTDEHPKYYEKITVTYHFYGKDFQKDKIEKAVKMSEERYCGVNFMLGKASEIVFDIVYHPSKQ